MVYTAVYKLCRSKAEIFRYSLPGSVNNAVSAVCKHIRISVRIELRCRIILRIYHNLAACVYISDLSVVIIRRKPAVESRKRIVALKDLAADRIPAVLALFIYAGNAAPVERTYHVRAVRRSVNLVKFTAVSVHEHFPEALSVTLYQHKSAVGKFRVSVAVIFIA